MHLIKKMVSAGWGYTVALRESVQDDVAQGRLSACPILAPAMSQKFFLSVSNQRKGAGAVGIIANLIRHWQH